MKDKKDVEVKAAQNVRKDNPAGRLYHLLNQARGLKGDGYIIWADVFEIPLTYRGKELEEETLERIIECVFQLRKLVDEVEAALTSIIGLNLSLYLTPFERVREVLKIRDLSISNYEMRLGNISDGDMSLIGICSETLSKHCQEVVVEDSEVKKLLDDMTQLYNSVSGSSLEHEMKVFILDELENLRRAIHEYRIRGFDRLREEMPGIVGSYTITREWANKAQPSSGEQGLVDAFLEILSRYGTVVSFASHTTKLLEAASTHLPRLLPGG